MSFEIDLDSVDPGNLTDCANWALETGIWDGRHVEWHEAPEFRKEIEARLIGYLFSQDPHSLGFQQLIASFAWLGARPDNRTLLLKDIQALRLTPEGVIVQAGLWKDVCKFVKKHKEAILVGTGTALLLVTIVVLSMCSGSTASAAAVAGGAVLDKLNKEEEEEKKKKERSPPAAAPPPPPPEPLVEIPIPESPTSLELLEQAHQEDLHAAFQGKIPLNSPPPPPGQFWPLRPFETIGRGMIDPDLLNPDMPLPQSEPSKRFETEGARFPHFQIGGINGIDTSLEGAQSHAAYLKRFVPEQSIDWVHNRSHGPLIDLAEVPLNYLGHSPNTANLLMEKWTAFHKANQENPHARCLQMCHSQGAIHVRNALSQLPEDVRNRVIVVAIAPAAVVPREFCYQSFNYASKRDIVPLGQLAFLSGLDTNETGVAKPLEMALEHHEELIILEPHKEATGIDHDFQSPTFHDRIRDHVQDYLNRNGVYE